MVLEWIYLLKVNAGIALFYAFYKLFCQRDTFFRWRRISLLAFLVVSFLYPLIDIQQWVQSQPAINELGNIYANWLMLDEVEVLSTPNKTQIPDTLSLITYIYYIGVILLSLRFIIQLCSIIRMRFMGKVEELNGQRIINMPTEVSPFSFFQWIFVYKPNLQEDNQQEILTHEQTHVEQGHSFDVIFSEMANIVCWFNPFMWLLKGEIRLNLEYLADKKVADSLQQDTKVYQYHLLGLASQKNKTGLYNNFNVSHLKRRIIMMNKKRTSMAGHLKYALFAPLAAALLLVSNISCTSTTEEDALQVCEQMPEFPGGMGECMKFLSKNIQYPEEAMKNDVQGRVIVQFVVKKDGSISDPTIARGVNPLLDKEALRVINAMPKWKPGMHEGKAVNVKYTIPVAFKLQGENADSKAAATPREAQVDENGVYMVCDQMPMYPGGMQELMKFLQKNIQYPQDAEEKGIQGRVIVQFVVEKDGSIKDIKVVRGIDPSLDKEALRVINAMPKWEPGKHKGEAVSVKYTVPVNFKVQ